MSWVKIIIVLLLAIIVFSLGSALFYLVKDRGKSKRVLKMLTVRIGLSLIVFVILMAAYMAGIISPRG